MADICRAVRLALKRRLTDGTYGFNAQFGSICGDYGVDPIVIDFDSDYSVNFAWGQVPPDLIEENSPLTYPVLTVDVTRGQQSASPQRLKAHQFSGQVVAVIEVHYSWGMEQTTDFASGPDAVVAAMYASLNNQSAANTDYVRNAGVDTGINYNQDLTFQKSPIIPAGENWRRTIQFIATFGVFQQ